MPSRVEFWRGFAMGFGSPALLFMPNLLTPRCESADLVALAWGEVGRHLRVAVRREAPQSGEITSSSEEAAVV